MNFLPIKQTSNINNIIPYDYLSIILNLNEQ